MVKVFLFSSPITYRTSNKSLIIFVHKCCYHLSKWNIWLILSVFSVNLAAKFLFELFFRNIHKCSPFTELIVLSEWLLCTTNSKIHKLQRKFRFILDIYVKISHLFIQTKWFNRLYLRFIRTIFQRTYSTFEKMHTHLRNGCTHLTHVQPSKW